MKILLIVLVALAVPSNAQWQRQVYSGKGAWTDTPQPHSLSYFTKDPFLRDDANDFCISCTLAEKATLHLKFKARTELRRIGMLSGFTLFDVLYYFEAKDIPDWKFVLVRTAPDEYREIFHVQRTQIDQQVDLSSLVKAGNETILSTRAFAGGNHGIEYGNYFWFDKDGPVMVDVDGPIRRAAEPLLPKGKALYGVWNVSLPALTASLPVSVENDVGCCSGGGVAIKFKLDQGKLVVTEAHYAPPDSQLVFKEEPPALFRPLSNQQVVDSRNARNAPNAGKTPKQNMKQNMGEDASLVLLSLASRFTSGTAAC